jgi:hypothetical protein
MSSLIAAQPCVPFLLFLRKCVCSYAIKILSVIRRPGIKALWFSEIITGKIFFSRFANTFKIILYSTLHRLMGLRSVTLSGRGTSFGRRTSVDGWLRGARTCQENHGLGPITEVSAHFLGIGLFYFFSFSFHQNQQRPTMKIY